MSYENSSNTADDCEADFDGLSNLLEYALERDFIHAGETSVLQIRRSLKNPSGMEVVFITIDDANISHRLQGSGTHRPDDREPVFSIGGIGHDSVIVTEPSWTDPAPYFFNFKSQALSQREDIFVGGLRTTHNAVRTRVL